MMLSIFREIEKSAKLLDIGKEMLFLEYEMASLWMKGPLPTCFISIEEENKILTKICEEFDQLIAEVNFYFID